LENNMGAGRSGSSGSADAPNTKRSVVTKVRSQTPIRDFIAGGGVTGAIIRGVSGAIQKSKTDKALQGTSDYQGSTSKSSVNSFGGSGEGSYNNSNMVVPIMTSPTTSEVSQSSATNATDTNSSLNKKYDERKTKAKGRSSTILTSSRGVKLDDKLTLGKKSLLGA
jgi:hypothetical protein